MIINADAIMAAVRVLSIWIKRKEVSSLMAGALFGDLSLLVYDSA